MSGTPQGTHSLAFRVMRLCQPSFPRGSLIRCNWIRADLRRRGEGIFDDPHRQLPSHLPPPSSSRHASPISTSTLPI
ncbi:hypothetical protein SLA2020_493480 [Shorea laevis]